MKINKTILLVALTAIAIPVSAIQPNRSGNFEKVRPLSPADEEKVGNVTSAVVGLHNAIVGSSEAKAAVMKAMANLSNAKTKAEMERLTAQLGMAIAKLQNASSAVESAVEQVKKVSAPNVLGTSAAKRAANLPLVNKAKTEAGESISGATAIIVGAQQKISNTSGYNSNTSGYNS
ncbi:MAG: hypothetical protein NTU89_03010 [Candidatus Dependentiae bacterium]|nr:hypothetical protein [Candidatus Dependentiae bacterium]